MSLSSAVCGGKLRKPKFVRPISRPAYRMVEAHYTPVNALLLLPNL